MDNHTIRLARTDEFDAVRYFYYDIIDYLETAPYSPGWKKDIYPSRDDLRNAIDRRELWVYELGGRIASAMILNSSRVEGYERLERESGISGESALFIHTLAVLPDFQRRGIASAMVCHAISIARERGCKAVRLDVLEGNEPAELVYTKLGFEFMYTMNIFYEDTGWADYKIYQLLMRS